MKKARFLIAAFIILVIACTATSCYQVSEICEHQLKGVEVIFSATCVSDGLGEATCEKCGETVKTTIPALGHTEVIDSGYEPTCTSAGLSFGKHCSVCNKTLEERGELPALGHTEYVAVTCAKTGYTLIKCSVCSCFVQAINTLPAGHSDGYCVDCGNYFLSGDWDISKIKGNPNGGSDLWGQEILFYGYLTRGRFVDENSDNIQYPIQVNGILINIYVGNSTDGVSIQLTGKEYNGSYLNFIYVSEVFSACLNNIFGFGDTPQAVSQEFYEYWISSGAVRK